MTLLIFGLILSVLVLVHEFGHYIVAKKLGIKVEEFGLGIPPRLIGKRIGETIYSLNLLPFGGFVRLEGEDPEEVLENPEIANDTRSFQMKSPFQRSLVLVAGVFMNMVLAITIFYFVLASTGFKTSYISLFFDYNFRFGKENVVGSVITSLQEGSAAEKSKMEVGEAIVEINGEPVNDVSDVRRIIKGLEGKEVYVFLMDVRKENNNIRKVTAIPQKDSNGDAVLGVYLSKAVQIDYSSGIDKYLAGFLHTYNVTDYSLKALSEVVSLSFKNKTLEPVSESVAGPVGMYNIVGSVLDYGGDRVVYTILDFVALMSASLAFMNIMPFPALDGGRLVFVIYEGITKRKVNPNIELNVHKIGFMVLLGLLVLITIKDVLFSNI